MLKVGFYDPKKKKMSDVEAWDSDLDEARLSAMFMTDLYMSGNHRMPSPIWCIWDDLDNDVCSIFILDNKDKPESLFNAAMASTKKHMSQG